MKALVVTSFLLFGHGKLLPSVALAQGTPGPQEPSDSGRTERCHMRGSVSLFSLAVRYFSPWLHLLTLPGVPTHPKPREQQEKLRGSRAPWPHKAVSVRVPIPTGMSPKHPRAAGGAGSAAGAPRQPFPGDLFLGLAPLPEADEPGPQLV